MWCLQSSGSNGCASGGCPVLPKVPAVAAALAVGGCGCLCASQGSYHTFVGPGETFPEPWILGALAWVKGWGELSCPARLPAPRTSLDLQLSKQEMLCKYMQHPIRTPTNDFITSSNYLAGFYPTSPS